MTESLSGSAFQQHIFDQLDHKLKQATDGVGAAQAHGLTVALICCGVTEQTLNARAELFQLAQADQFVLIDALFGLALRDLKQADFKFNLLLPDDDASLTRRLEALKQWCDGFILGLGHEQTGALEQASQECREAIGDLQQMAELELPQTTSENEERQLLELQEYVRMAAQLIYAELGQNPSAPG